jgi:hypothetical protein
VYGIDGEPAVAGGATPRGMEEVSREVESVALALGDSGTDESCEDPEPERVVEEPKEERKVVQEERVLWSTGRSDSGSEQRLGIDAWSTGHFDAER